MKCSNLVFIVLVLAGVWVGTRAETDEPSPAPTEPTLTLGKSVGTDEVVLTWTSTTSPYVASRDTDPNPNDFTPTVLASGLSGSTFSDPGLTNGINYYYLVADSNTPPKVYGRSANAGLPGDSVTFTGVGFATLMSDNKVLIAGEPALITGATTTSLTFTIPATWVSGQTIVVTPRGANIGGTIYDIGTQGLSNISTVGVDSLGTKFVSDLGTTGTSDRVFTFNPSTGVRTQVGALNEATGLPADGSDRLYFGNGLFTPETPYNFGSIRRTDRNGNDVAWGRCGDPTDNNERCYVLGMGFDPSRTDYAPEGRVYAADGFANRVRIVRPLNDLAGPAVTFATGFTFSSAPQGIVVDREPTSATYQDVYVADSTKIRRYGSANVPGTLEQTYDATAFPILSPRQLAITPGTRVRLLFADSAHQRVVMINPATNAAKKIDIQLTSPRAIAVEYDAFNNISTAWVGEQSRVLKIPVYKTVYLSIWRARGAGISDQEIRQLVLNGSAVLSRCGVELQIRDDVINAFDAGDLLDLEVNQTTGTTGCGDPLYQTTPEEVMLMTSPRRSAVPTDLNVYFVKSFTNDSDRIGEALTGDCFFGMNDQEDAGVVISAQRLHRNSITGGDQSGDTLWTLGHEVGHALLDRSAWGGDEHQLPNNGGPLPASNLMRMAGAVNYDMNVPAQCVNINADLTIFRGDP